MSKVHVCPFITYLNDELVLFFAHPSTSAYIFRYHCLKGLNVIALHEKPIIELLIVTCHIGSLSVTFHLVGNTE